MYVRRIGGRSAARANMLHTPPTLTRPSRRRRVRSSTVPDVTAAPTYVYSRLTYPRHLFPSFYHNFNLYSSGGASPPTSPLRQHQIRVPLPALHTPPSFSRLSTTILTFLEAVEPYLQRHPYTNIGFRFHSSPYIHPKFFPSFYHHFNFF